MAEYMPACRKIPDIIRFCCHNGCKHFLKSGRSFPNAEKLFPIPFLKPCEHFTTGKIMEKVEEHLKICQTCSRADLWVKLCAREDGSFMSIRDIKADSYICSRHFVNEYGPTDKYPNPIPPTNYRKYSEVDIFEEKKGDGSELSDLACALPSSALSSDHPPRIVNPATGAIPKTKTSTKSTKRRTRGFNYHSDESS